MLNLSETIETRQKYQIQPESDSTNKYNLYKPLSRRVITDLIAVFEAILIVACALLAKLLYVDIYLNGAEPEFSYLGVGITGGILNFVLMKRFGHYDPNNILSSPAQFQNILGSLLASFFLLLAVAFLLKVSDSYSRIWLLSWFALSLVTVSFARFGSVRGLKYLSHFGLFNKRVVIIGVEPLCLRLSNHVTNSKMDVDLIRTFSIPEIIDQQKFMDKALTDKLHELVAFAKVTRIDRVIIALPSFGSARIQEILLELGQLTAQLDFCPGEIALEMNKPEMSYVGDIGLYNVQKTPIQDWGVATKRFFDLAIVVPGLFVAGIPMLIIAYLIRRSSPGNILFVQPRHGLDGEVIKVMKFRTMTDKDRNNSVHQVKKNDAEVTSVGKFLRRWSLDELPQLLNVLKGDMSIVGSRPHPIKLDEKFADVVQLNKDFGRLERYAARYKVKPGITGWAQVNGARGETDTRAKMEKRVKLDLHYINNWSIWLDMKILLLTVTAVIRGENAH